GAAGIALIDRRVRLDEILIAGYSKTSTSNGTDYTHRDRLPDGEGITDRQDGIANLQLIAVTNYSRRQILCLDFEDRDVGRRVGPYDLGVIFFVARSQRDFHAVGSFDDMVGGENITI